MAKPIVISVLGDTRDLNSKLSSSESRLSRFGGAAGKAGKALAFGLAGGAVAAVAVGSKLVTMGEAAGTSNARIANVAQSMGLFGEQADQVSNRLVKLAEKQARATGVDQNAIKATQAKLLTFGQLADSADKIGGNFDRATAAAVDLASAGFGTAEGNAAQLGKALNDPIKGLASLAKSGVTFTDAEKARIATLVESNKMGQAQAVVLKAIETQVGGTAAATANGTDRIKVAFSQMGEAAGQKLTPYVDKFADVMVDKVLPAFLAAGPQVAAFASSVGGVLGPALATVGTLVSGTILPALVGIGGSVMTNVVPALAQLGGFLVTNVVPVLSTVGTAIMTTVVPALLDLGRYVIGTVVPAVIALYGKVAANLLPVITTLADTFATRVAPTIALVVTRFKTWLPTIITVVSAVVTLASAILGKVLPPVIRFAGFLIGTLVPVALDVVGAVIKIVGAVVGFGVALVGGVKSVARFATAVGDKVGAVLDYFRALPGKITGALSDAGTMLKGIGTQIVQGLIDGLDSGRQWIIDKISALGALIPGWLKRKLGIASPSRVTTLIGKQTGQGLVLGLESQRRPLRDTLDSLAKMTATTLAGPSPAKITTAGPSLGDDVTPRPRFSTAAQQAAAGAMRGRQAVTVTLDAEQLHELERGRRLALDLRPYTAAGGVL